MVEAYQASFGRLQPKDAALLAVGAFGRAELFPYSEIDILIVHQPESRETVKDQLPGFMRLLWERGLRLNPRISTLDECLQAAEQSLDLPINVLDRRLLAGQGQLAADFERKLSSFFESGGLRLARSLCQLTRARHERYGRTPYHAEPDVKECPGGLRDFRLMRRIERLVPGLASEAEELKQPGTFLAASRCFLHFRAQADRNVLDLAAQRAMAGPPFGFTIGRYLDFARLVFNQARGILEAVEAAEAAGRPSPLDDADVEFTLRAKRVYLQHPGPLQNDSGLLLRALLFVGEHGTPLTADTERRFESARDAWAASCDVPQNLWPVLRTILSLPHVAVAVRSLRSMLGLIVPQWPHIERTIVTDPEHRYVAGEHTLCLLDCITALGDVTDSVRRRFADLFSEIDDIPALLFAVLVHESDPGVARSAAARVGMPAEEQDVVEFLVKHQQDLTNVVSGRDPGDPATARLLATRVGTIERLKLLAVFSYAEIAATDPEAAVLWRLEQLWRAYAATRQELTRELETDRIESLPATLPSGAAFIRGFPTRYLRSRTADDISLHARLYELSRLAGVAVDLKRTETAYRITIMSRDRPYLFASLSAAISSFGLDILQAEAFSNSAGIVLDTFVFGDPKRTLESNPPEAERLQDLVRRVGLGKTDGRRLLRNQGQRGAERRSFAPRVQFDSDACETATLVEIVAEDRPGLLYSLANAISSMGCNIDVVLIDTKGQRAIDVFYVAHQGGKLTSELQAELESKLVAAC